MKKLFFLFLTLLMPMMAHAQDAPLPGWYKKVQKSIVSIISYNQNKEMIHEGVGYVATEDGVVLSDYDTFRDAYSAVVVDMKGKQYNVVRILGADSSNGLVRSQTDMDKATPLKIASPIGVNRGAQVLAIGFYKDKPNVVPTSTVGKKDMIDSKYGYYTLTSEFDGNQVGKGAFNDAGDLIGIIQSSIGGKSGVIDASMAMSLSMAAIQSNNQAIALNNIHIKKALPDTAEESLVYLYFRSTTADDAEYMDLVDQFVEKFPDNAEGYHRRATPLIDLHRFDEADQSLQKYIQLSTDKNMAYSKVADVIYTKVLYQPEPAYDKWNYDTALSYIDKAISGIEPSIAAATDSIANRSLLSQKIEYQILKAKILSSKGDYRGAISIYDEINSGPFRAPAFFMASSMQHALAGDSLSVQIDIMNSAIAEFGDPLPADAAPYILQRAQLYEADGQYRKAVGDFNTYLYLKNNKVNDSFYYDRSVLEMNARMYQQALDDIDKALSLSPNNPDYLLHKSSVNLVVSQIDECISAARKCIQLKPDMAQAYRILGYALLQKGDKNGARTNLERAKSLGDESAQEIMDMYLK